LDQQHSVIPPWYDDLMKANMTWLVKRYLDGIKLVEKWYEDLPSDVKQSIDNVWDFNKTWWDSTGWSPTRMGY
jgi:hypothetical protein